MVTSLRSLIARAARAMSGLHPAKLAAIGYFFYIAIGWIALCMPFAQHGSVGSLDALFISTSAVSTTGLATCSTGADFTFTGQLIILLLIQVGGIGYMTFGSFVVLSRGGTLPAGRDGVARTVFSLPESFRMDSFIRSVVVFTAVIEVAGTLALWSRFAALGVADPLWSAVFHSVSTFCTAGFSLYDTSMESFRSDFWVQATVSVLAIAGAVGFIVWVDVWRMATGASAGMTLTSRIILAGTAICLVGGTTLVFLTESSISSLAAEDRILAAWFLVMSSLTTVGFNSVPIASLAESTLLVVIVLMVIGASPSGTGGGVKITSISALFGVMRSAMRDEEVKFWGRDIPQGRVRAAIAGIGFYAVMLLAGAFLLELAEGPGRFVPLFFEAASALGTVGLSAGVTASLTPLGKLVIILLMFVGRVGPLTLSIALFVRSGPPAIPRDSDLAI